MKKLKYITEKLVVKFVEKGNTVDEATNIVLTLLKEYTKDLEKKRFSLVAEELRITWL
tara:strand:- start:1707 stop:1880 length:174 start_codon:yes stop_codon:yes gene_type:complete